MSYNTHSEIYNEKNVILQPAQVGDEQSNEKTRLHQEPVKLQPSWEENNLPEDELNFENLTMDQAGSQLNAPPDRYKLVYCTFLIHGIGNLMPWTMFITAFTYFTNHKLASSYIGYDFPYVPKFMQYLTFSAQIPNLIINWMNIFVHIGGNLTTRIVWSISLEVVIFIITVLLAMIDTSGWPYGFFYITMICVVLLNMASGVYQNTTFGMAAKLPPKYTGAVVLGNNISGTFTAIVQILSSLLTSNIRMAAIYYFITAIFVLLIAFDTYFALPLNKFYRHYELREKKFADQQKQTDNGVIERTPYLYIIKKAMPQLINVYLMFFVTLAVFPSIHASIIRSENFFIKDQGLYSSITCFLTFSVSAMLGSLLPSFVQWPGPKFLWIPVSLRLLYIPFYLICNYQVPDVTRVLPVLIHNDWVYWIGAITMGLTGGYFSSLAMMYAPRTVEDRYAATAGMLAAALLMSGIFSGVLISFLWPWVISHIG